MIANLDLAIRTNTIKAEAFAKGSPDLVLALLKGAIEIQDDGDIIFKAPPHISPTQLLSLLAAFDRIEVELKSLIESMAG